MDQITNRLHPLFVQTHLGARDGEMGVWVCGCVCLDGALGCYRNP